MRAAVESGGSGEMIREQASSGGGLHGNGGGSGGGRSCNGGDESRSDEGRETSTIGAMEELLQSVGDWRTVLKLKKKFMEEAT